METIISPREDVSQPEEQGGDEATRIKNIITDTLRSHEIELIGLKEGQIRPNTVEVLVDEIHPDNILIAAGGIINQRLHEQGIDRTVSFPRGARQIFPRLF